MAKKNNQQSNPQVQPPDSYPGFIGTDEDLLPVLKKTVRLRQGDELLQLNEDERASNAVHNLARMQRMAYAKRIGLTAEELKMCEQEPNDMRLGDDDNSVRIENYYANGSPTTQQPQQATSTPVSSQPANTPTTPAVAEATSDSTIGGWKSKLAKWAPTVGALVLGTGLGGLAISQMNRPGADTEYQLQGDFEETPTTPATKNNT
jgi:hypothetical protein